MKNAKSIILICLITALFIGVIAEVILLYIAKHNDTDTPDTTVSDTVDTPVYTVDENISQSIVPEYEDDNSTNEQAFIVDDLSELDIIKNRLRDCGVLEEYSVDESELDTVTTFDQYSEDMVMVVLPSYIIYLKDDNTYIVYPTDLPDETEDTDE